MKSSKSNSKISVVEKKFFEVYPPYDPSTIFRHSSGQLLDFTVHYNKHHESTYVRDNPCKLCMLWRKFHYLDFLARTGIVGKKLKKYKVKLVLDSQLRLIER
jgi:hypothetical protein